ncbi:hypothetical protein ACFY36_36085 [Actinoplanes sp. NPDC000266]
MNRWPIETTAATAAGIGSVAAYLTGIAAEYAYRHPVRLAVAALLVSIARTRASRLGR